MKSRLISVFLIITIIMSFMTECVFAQSTFSELFDADLKAVIDTDSNTAKGIITLTSLNGVNTDTHKLTLVMAFFGKKGNLLNIEKSPFSSITMTSEKQSFEMSASIPEKTATVKVFAFNGLTSIAPVAEADVYKVGKTLRVLGIGNSYTEGAMAHLYNIAEDAGYEDITLARLYIGSCSLDTHWSNFQSNASSYEYWKNTGSGWVKDDSKRSALYGIQDEDWDIIVTQQASGSSGKSSTYSNLQNIVDYINENKTNPYAKLAWHMTWAYKEGLSTLTNNGYDDQLDMYNKISSAVQEKVLTNDAFSYIIPAGTTIQNARTSFARDLDNDFVRDGNSHLSLPFGRFMAALTWFKVLTGESVEDITYRPTYDHNNGVNYEGVTDTAFLVACEAVNNAVKTPFAVTTSKFTTEPDLYEGTEPEPDPEYDSAPETLEGFSLNTDNLRSSMADFPSAETGKKLVFNVPAVSAGNTVKYYYNDRPVASVTEFGDGMVALPIKKVGNNSFVAKELNSSGTVVKKSKPVSVFGVAYESSVASSLSSSWVKTAPVEPIKAYIDDLKATAEQKAFAKALFGYDEIEEEITRTNVGVSTNTSAGSISLTSTKNELARYEIELFIDGAPEKAQPYFIRPYNFNSTGNKYFRINQSNLHITIDGKDTGYTIVPDTWHTITTDISVVTDAADVYVDDILIARAVLFTGMESFGSAKYYSPYADSNMYYDSGARHCAAYTYRQKPQITAVTAAGTTVTVTASDLDGKTINAYENGSTTAIGTATVTDGTAEITIPETATSVYVAIVDSYGNVLNGIDGALKSEAVAVE